MALSAGSLQVGQLVIVTWLDVVNFVGRDQATGELKLASVAVSLEDLSAEADPVAW